MLRKALWVVLTAVELILAVGLVLCLASMFIKQFYGGPLTDWLEKIHITWLTVGMVFACAVWETLREWLEKKT